MSTFRNISIQKLYEIIKLRPKKNSTDEIGLDLTKNLYHVLGYPLANLMILSLEKGVVPASFKVSTVVPI